jgi:hypothetical protein
VLPSDDLFATDPADAEVLVADARAALTPAQMVEHKLSSLLKGKLVPVSHVLMASMPGNRPRG